MNLQPEDSDFNYSGECNYKPHHPILCCSAVLPQAKIIQGLFLLIYSFLAQSGISATRDVLNTIRAVPSRRSRPHTGAWITRPYWISNMVNKTPVGWKSQYAKPQGHWNSGLEDLWRLTNMWRLLIQHYQGNHGFWCCRISRLVCFARLCEIVFRRYMTDRKAYCNKN